MGRGGGGGGDVGGGRGGDGWRWMWAGGVGRDGDGDGDGGGGGGGGRYERRRYVDGQLELQSLSCEFCVGPVIKIHVCAILQCANTMAALVTLIRIL